MQLDITQSVYNMKGQQFVLRDQDGNLTKIDLGEACVIALCQEYRNEQANGRKKAERFRLYLAIRNGEGSADLSEGDVKTIMEVIELYWSPLVYGQVEAMLKGEPNPLKPASPAVPDDGLLPESEAMR